MNNLYPKCSICGGTPTEGLYDGFRLAKKFICSRCENRIVITSMDTLEYLDNVYSIRKLLYG